MGKITIDTLAGMMNKSFEHLEKEIKADIREVKERLDTVEIKLDHIEGLVEGGQERRITKLEDDMRVVKTTLGK